MENQGMLRKPVDFCWLDQKTKLPSLLIVKCSTYAEFQSVSAQASGLLTKDWTMALTMYP